MATYKTYPKLRLLTKEMTLKIEENCCPLAYDPQFTYTASVCNVIYFSSCVSAICWLICMKLSGFVYFEMGIEVQPFPTSIRPLNGQLASLQPHSGLQGHDSLNKNCSTFDFRTSYGKKFWIFNVWQTLMEVIWKSEAARFRPLNVLVG